MKYVVKRRTVYADGRFNVDDTQPVDDFTTLKEAQRFMRKRLLDDAVLSYLARYDEQFKDCMRFVRSGGSDPSGGVGVVE